MTSQAARPAASGVAPALGREHDRGSRGPHLGLALLVAVVVAGAAVWPSGCTASTTRGGSGG